MGNAGAAGLVAEVRDFLAGLRLALPELRPAPIPAPRRVPADPVRQLFADRVGHWSALMGVSPKRIFLKNQRTLWGSCSTRGNLNFNRVLADLPPEILDYVVIHELAHLREMNHSRRFWAVVESFCPEQKQRRRWLRRNVSLLRSRAPAAPTAA